LYFIFLNRLVYKKPKTILTLRMKNTLLLILFLFFTIAFSQESNEDGLLFSSREVIKEKRTSLNLTPEKPLHFKNGFSLEFDSDFRQKDGYYGNICKIVGNKVFNIDLISNFELGLNSQTPSFTLVVNNEILSTFSWQDIPQGGIEKWMKFKIEVDNVNSTISLSINGQKKSKKIKGLEGIEDFEIVFGKSNLKNFISTDVSPMSIKHIRIKEGDKLIRYWILGKHLKNNTVYDEINNERAVTTNPIWLLDQHLYWSKNFNFKFTNLLGTAQDEKNGRAFFIDQKAVYVYHLRNKVMDTLKYSKNPYPCRGNNFIYNEKTNEIWSYSFDKNLIVKFNFATAAWSSNETACIEPNFWHHNKLISPKDGSLITFGGYGHYKYKNSIKTIDSKTSIWNTIDYHTTIDPRYLSASGILNKDQFLVFGGYGSKSGNQAVNSHCYYDLYTVDFSGFKIRQLWKKDNLEGTPFVPVGSMVIDSKSKHFYSLVYDNNTFNTTLKLARFGINKFDISLFPDTVPYKFLDIKSNGSLFLDANKFKLYALTVNEGDVSLYSLSYPPLLAEDVYQKEPFSFKSILYILLIGVLIIGVLLFIYKRELKKGHQPKIAKQTYIKPVLENQIDLSVHNKIKKSAFYLFGGFEVFDKDGKDITALFTPTLKQLFLLILLSRSKNEKGITSNKIIENLWYDKSENSARNNKNVNISKLKLLLEKVGDVEVNNDNTYWTIQFGENVFCDYSYVTKLLSGINKNTNEDDKIVEFLNIISAGEICPDVQTEWIESFKVDISNRIIDGLDYLAKNKKSHILLELIANTILKYDPFNEEAIIIKCKSLYALGKKGLAKQSYDDFCKEYLTLLDAKFNVAFKDIIE
jgi:two-component SAPR family response regulator